MSVEVIMDTPLAHSLNSVIQPKLVEVGWSSGGGDEGQLAEYILLMLANNKTQDQIAAELSSDLLGLGPDDPGAREFSQWLFHQIDILNSQQNGTDGPAMVAGGAQDPAMQDAEMGDVSEALGDGKVPTGPKSMRDGPGPSRPRDKRMLGHLAKAMSRTNDSVLHRVRPQNGSERINTHSSRAPPTGPRQQAPGRGGVRNLNSRVNEYVPTRGAPMQQGNIAASIMSMSSDQQFRLYSMLEQQSKLMAQMIAPQQQMGMGNGFQQQQPGRSLFERVQRPQNNGRGNFQQHSKFGGQQQYKHLNHHPRTGNDAQSSSMDVEMPQETKELDPENTKCRFNLACTNPDCKFAHQSPAAPPSASIDFKDTCSFGAACKNKKCTGKHPSPSQKTAYQTAQQCRWGSDCTNPNCTFVHPTACRNGADCTIPNCKFGHTKIVCKFNPCERPTCQFKHVEGQKRGKFEDKVWTADSAKEHVSERRFVKENAEEELIVPGAPGEGLIQESSATIKTENAEAIM